MRLQLRNLIENLGGDTSQWIDAVRVGDLPTLNGFATCLNYGQHAVTAGLRLP
jgi:hypothetical protein